MLSLNADIRYLKGVGEKRSEIFRKVGINTFLDFLYYFPRDWKDFSKVKRISEVKINESATLLVKVVSIKNIFTRRRGFTLTEGIFSDESGGIRAIWFNQPYLKTAIKEGGSVYLAGLIMLDKGLTLKNPVYEIADKKDTKHLARITPVYKEIGPVSSRMIRHILKPILDDFIVEEFLPDYIVKKKKFLGIKEALLNIHFPKNKEILKKAKDRLSFDELFIPQVLNQLVRRKLKNEKSYSININKTFLKKVSSGFNFALTNSQIQALAEIQQDVKNSFPMNRLLEGDVGSGKTVVSAVSLIIAVNSGFQGALMVPTEVLAWEHFETLSQVFKPFNISIRLVTGSTKKKDKEIIYQELSNGSISVIVGTHALLNDNLTFKNLGLAVIDEQHRFGVNQRKKLREKNKNIMPHLLSMTATPIPRTYALTVYGDLDISLLKDMPQGERKTKTFLVPGKKRKDAYEFIKKQLKKGSKAIVICPAINESDRLGIKAVEAEYKKLKNGIFKNEKLGMLHGKMSTKEKQAKIADFKSSNINIMVSTTVIEVGLNIKNLNVMMIENAERFGLAQLHQLRGRIGRAGEESFFLMFSPSTNLETLARLKEVTNIQDGFKLAEYDLELRGQGNIFGIQQSGTPELRLTSFSDYDLLKEASLEAVSLIRKDPNLIKYNILKEKIGNFYKGVHAE